MKKFNTTGLCNPDKHYMVDIKKRLEDIKKLVDSGEYFCINRARQYGKTTTLSALRKILSSQYEVVSISFQGIGKAGYESEESFVQSFSRLIRREKRTGVDIPLNTFETFSDFVERKDHRARLDELYDAITEWCAESGRPVVLMIDEVDTASENQVFLDFLAQLREGYLSREDKGAPALHSVILAGVTDVKHLKSKIRPDEDGKENSPWNIAADFDIDMSLPEEGIKGMLNAYESDHHTGMDTGTIAKRLRKYTSGYPYLVSRLCQLMDGPVGDKIGLSEAWTEQGMDEAIKIILADNKDPLFGSVMGKLVNLPQLKRQLRDILMKGDAIAWLPDDEEQKLLYMYGFIKNEDNTVKIANRLFEMRLYQYFLGENRKNDAFRSDALVHKSIFINDDHSLNMPLILEHFVDTQKRVHGKMDDKFLEEEGRERFLTYIVPIINGTGTYSIEEQTRNKLRMDVVIHYLGKRYVVELKIWRGPRYNEDGEKQIMEYLDYFDLSTGYMVSFNFNRNKESGVKRIIIGDKVLFEATV
ncbi:MAG: AAA-like domain-containing protein [Clostridia bacterium]|nr:AAA-like domain-containing protein [Clostridia bacterium]